MAAQHKVPPPYDLENVRLASKNTEQESVECMGSVKGRKEKLSHCQMAWIC